MKVRVIFNAPCRAHLIPRYTVRSMSTFDPKRTLKMKETILRIIFQKAK